MSIDIYKIFNMKNLICIVILILSYLPITFCQSHFLTHQVEGSSGNLQLNSGISESKQIDVKIKPTVDIQPMNLCSNCSGYLEKSALVKFEWKGSTGKLKVQYVPENSEDGNLLLVKTPEDIWLFNDKSDQPGGGTMIYLSGFEEGIFSIWAGGIEKDKEIKGRIIIIERDIDIIEESFNNDQLNVGFVPTSDEALSKMLEFADLKFDDHLIDLGCGDGRIVIEAAKRGVSGYGVDLDPSRIEESWENAKKAGVSNMVNFEVMNLFDLDLSEATVLTMYLLEEINLKLKPKLFEQLKPGTRVVSNTFSMGDWRADKTWGLDCGNVYLWIIPANAKGKWQWMLNNRKYEAEINQIYQLIQVQLYEEGTLLQTMESKLSGEKITILAKNTQTGSIIKFDGIVKDNNISGTFEQMEKGIRTSSDWKASKVDAKH